MRRVWIGSLVAAFAALLVAACGGSGVSPSPTPGGGGGGGGGGQVPPANSPPVIESITIQGTRAKEPAAFADLGETVAVSAKVTDAETVVDQLQYVWTATTGTFSGAGASVTWQAPAQAPASQTAVTPTEVTITLTVTERFGNPGQPPAFEQSVAKTAPVSLHDSAREVGDMSRQFLLDFSDSGIRDVAFIMRNFSKARCPQPNEVDSEFGDVSDNRQTKRIVDSRVDAAAVSVSFGGICPYASKRGDACAIVPVFWDSIDLPTNKRGTTRGNDIIAAAYAPADSRWWLCASNYQGLSTFGVPFHR